MAIKVDSDELKKRFDQLIDNTRDSDALKQLGFFVIKTIRHRTRKLGKGVIRRATLSKSPEAATGRKSNLTFKGTMLDSMVIKKASRGQLFIGFKNAREEAKAEGNTDRGRPFMNLGKVEIRNASQFYKEKILSGV
jgi:hypothetical protein